MVSPPSLLLFWRFAMPYDPSVRPAGSVPRVAGDPAFAMTDAMLSGFTLEQLHQLRSTIDLAIFRKQCGDRQ